MKHAISMSLVLALAGCGGGIGFGSGGGGLFGGDGGGGLFGRDRTAPSAAMTPGEDTLRPEERPGGEGAAEPSEGGLILGFAVASLGDASVPGLWLETPLVSAEGPGRVIGPDGRTIVVTLRPSGGGPGTGSRLSLQAMQALGLDLASLPTVTVISDA
ncbi:D-galactarate dehydratase [Roseibacterium sp. SDUM158016]|uniref:D-galactarate dehydratase n=1 Tax=Roseicyclus sediminis TaxID=2980997 RepID=UPI0021CF83C2|nr:D-galactarate dehydratase [Roseibacterium sp. SDUM158016]MCU4653676.1 D-galactarate dehydratase [Roseibacterium sp. SDUM158016]